MIEVFSEISIILVIAAVMAVLMRLLKQPLIIGHIATGLIVGLLSLEIFGSIETLEVFSKIGIALLLFIVGLSLSPKVIREVGKVSLVTGLGQIIFTSGVGLLISMALGFALEHALYISVALTFSSTIIIMKLLSDKHALQKLYGRISIGFLLVQDVVAIIFLVAIPYLSGGAGESVSTEGLLLSGGIIVAVAIFSLFILPKATHFFAQSQEFLFLFSIAWGLGLASLFMELGLSLEIGALIAGISLSVSPYHYEIGSKMKPLRDFFIMMFFLLLGLQMQIGDISQFAVPIIIFSAFVLIGNPLIVMTLMGAMGYDKKTGFMAGLTVAQISEFSLILVALGVEQGHLPPDIRTLVTMVGLITIASSTYMIYYSDKIYSHLSRYLSIFEKKKLREQRPDIDQDYDIVLFGCHRVGQDFLKSFMEMGAKFLVVEADPAIIAELSSRGINTRYGDAADLEFLDELGLEKVKMLVSTIPDAEPNIVLVGKAKRANPGMVIMSVAYSIEEAMKLYGLGASYVILPHFLGGQQASLLAAQHKFDHKKFLREKEKHLKYLAEKKKAGHEHPKREQQYEKTEESKGLFFLDDYLIDE
jgi:Kef-type K+ transport system membrane component KefB/Trk K+ transport system NAD-binding subunit